MNRNRSNNKTLYENYDSTIDEFSFGIYTDLYDFSDCTVAKVNVLECIHRGVFDVQAYINFIS